MVVLCLKCMSRVLNTCPEGNWLFVVVACCGCVLLLCVVVVAITNVHCVLPHYPHPGCVDTIANSALPEHLLQLTIEYKITVSKFAPIHAYVASCIGKCHCIVCSTCSSSCIKICG
jgi:hypothetical protein